MSHWPRPAISRVTLSRRRFLALATAATTAGSAPGAAPAVARASQPRRAALGQTAAPDFAELVARVAALQQEHQIPGVAIGVLHQGQEHVAGFGVTNVDAPLPVDGDALFQIGSNTKTYTMMAIMRLVDQGRLELDAPVRRYLPELQLSDPDVAARVTLRHLLTHTSGLPANLFVALGGGDDALARYVGELASLPLVLPLGLYPSYSNPALSLAGRVLEVATGLTYEAALQDLVLDPLGMTRSFFFAADVIRYAATVGHLLVDEQPRVLRPWAFPRTAHPAGGLVSSVRDQLRYARCWLRDGTAPDGTRLLSPAALAQIQTVQSSEPGGLGKFGLSWVLADVGGIAGIQHTGGTVGQEALLYIVPERGFALCVLTNLLGGGAILGPVLEWAQEHYLGVPPAPPPEPTPLALSAAELAAYAGRYANPGEMEYTLTVHNGGLQLQGRLTDPYMDQVQPQPPADAPVQVAFAERDELYAVEAPAARGSFLRYADGRLRGLFWGGRFNVRLD